MNAASTDNAPPGLRAVPWSWHRMRRTQPGAAFPPRLGQAVGVSLAAWPLMVPARQCLYQGRTGPTRVQRLVRPSIFVKMLAVPLIDTQKKVKKINKDIWAKLFPGVGLATSSMASSISPTHATFDQNPNSAQYADVPVTLTLNGNTLLDIKNGNNTLIESTDYSVYSSTNTVTISKSYLEAQWIGNTDLTFNFSAEPPVIMDIAIQATTPLPVVAVSLNKSTDALTVGGRDTLVPTIIPFDANNHNVTWYSDNASVATVDSRGNVTAVAPGIANIEVITDDGNKTATCAVTANTDTQPPTWPIGSSLTSSNVTQNSLTLTWTPATDDVGVVSYAVYQGTTQFGTVGSSVYTYNVTGLSAGTDYAFAVQAGDAAGNRSTDGPTTTVTTVTASSGGGGGGGFSTTNTKSSNSATISPATGGSVSLGNDVLLTIPAKALSGDSDATVEAKVSNSPPATPSGFEILGNVYQFTVNSLDHYTFNQPVSLTFTIDPSKIPAGETPARRVLL